jgi:NAD(P)-dependent dehydrogenase (short-subunit alcohol dehydrogenase family)
MAAVLITGANRGLGFEFARQYATDGWRALTACRNPATAGELRRLAQDRRGRLNVVAMDVTDAQSVREAATQLKDISIDVLNGNGRDAERKAASSSACRPVMLALPVSGWL